jgi:hypothetical protein
VVKWIYAGGYMEDKFRKCVERTYNGKPFSYLYMKFKKTRGVAKNVCAEGMAECLINEPRFIVEEDIEIFLNTIELDSVWHLARECKNEHIRELARDKIIKVLIDDQNRPIMEEKIKEDEASYCLKKTL